MTSKLEQLQEYLDGTADQETAALIEAELRDPSSDLAAFFDVSRERAKRFSPTTMDWNQFFETDDPDSTLR